METYPSYKGYETDHGVGSQGSAGAYDFSTVTQEVPTITVAQWLKRPANVYQRVQELSNYNFIVDAILRPGYNAQGGVVPYVQSAPIFMNDDPQEIPEGGEYPLAYPAADVTALEERVKKYGFITWISEELVRRSVFPEVERRLELMRNSMVRYLDGIFLNRIINDPGILTRATTGAAVWNSTNANIDLDIVSAKADIMTQGRGYVPDTMIIHSSKTPGLTTNDEFKSFFNGNVANLNPFFVGQLPGRLYGLDILETTSLPASNFALILQRKQIGGIAEEVPLQTKVLDFDEFSDRVFIKARRQVAMFLLEPKALVKVTGV